MLRATLALTVAGAVLIIAGFASAAAGAPGGVWVTLIVLGPVAALAAFAVAAVYNRQEKQRRRARGLPG